VNYRLHPLARWVASPPWVLERLPLPHLHHGSATVGRATMHARRAVTAPVCAHAQRRTVTGHAGRGWPGKAVGRVRYANGSSQHCGRGPCITVQLGRARIQPSGSRIKFSIFRIYSNPCKFKNLCRIHLNSENYKQFLLNRS
jgi:hypothetical protein